MNLREKSDAVLEHILGDTWAIKTNNARIPLYMPDRNNAVMIDAGYAPTSQEAILGLLEQENIHVRAVLVSHWHIDHVGCIPSLQEKYGTHTYMSRFAWIMINSFNMERKSVFSYPFLVIPNENLTLRDDEHLIASDATEISVCGYTFQILRYPGHETDNMGYVTPDNVVYLSDTILSQDVLHSIRIPYFADWDADLKTKRQLLDHNFSACVMAHNGVVIGSGRQIIQANIDNMLEKIELVASLCEQEITIEDLTSRMVEVTAGKPDVVGKVNGTRRNTEKVLEYLFKNGRLEIFAKDGYVYYRTKEADPSVKPSYAGIFKPI